MKISIVITTYNARTHIIATLESIMRQSYQKFEIIVIDDGSTDNTITIVNDFAKINQLENLKIYPLKHIGRAAALNYGVNVANYDWIAIIDADDLWNFNKLAVQVTFIQKFNLSFLATKSKVFFDNDYINIHQDSNINYLYSSFKKITLNKMLLTNLISHSSILIRKNLLYYNQNRKSQIDYEMWLRLLQNKTALYILPYALTYHRIHKNQSFEAKKLFKYAFNATLLQLRYCSINFKPLHAALVILKFSYYAILPRKVRLFLREVLL